MTYSVKEIYFTHQGEGAHTGRAAVFCRFAGCNLWSGREQDRATAVCRFCDTDFLGTDGPGGGRFVSAEDLARAVAACWEQAAFSTGRGTCPDITFSPGFTEAGAPSSSRSGRFVVCTGGEPALQLDRPLVDAFHAHDFEVAVETNGTLRLPENLDWICMSPKAGTELVVTRGDELKLVYPQEGASPEQFEHLQFEHFFLQPMDGPRREENTLLAAQYCRAHPRWRLSLQTHKLIGLP